MTHTYRTCESPCKKLHVVQIPDEGSLILCYDAQKRTEKTLKFMHNCNNVQTQVPTLEKNPKIAFENLLKRRLMVI